MSKSTGACSECGQVDHETRAHTDPELGIVAALAALRDGQVRPAVTWLQLTRKNLRAERQARIDRDGADMKRGLELEREREEVFGP